MTMLKTYTGQSSDALGFCPSLRQMTHKKIFVSTFWILSKCVSGQYFTATCKLILFFFFPTPSKYKLILQYCNLARQYAACSHGSEPKPT